MGSSSELALKWILLLHQVIFHWLVESCVPVELQVDASIQAHHNGCCVITVNASVHCFRDKMLSYELWILLHHLLFHAFASSYIDALLGGEAIIETIRC